MLDAKLRKFFNKKTTTVGEIIEELKKFDPSTPFGVDGDNYFYLHTNKENLDEDKVNGVSLDSSSLDETYLEQGNYEELPEYED